MKSKQILGVISYLLWILLVFSPALSSSEEVRDYWLKTERKGVGFSNEHIMVRKLADGNYEYAIQSHIKTDLVGCHLKIKSGLFFDDLKIKSGLTGPEKVKTSVRKGGLYYGQTNSQVFS